MNIKGRPIYISPSCWFDPTDFSLITIEDQVVISSNVSLLTHDYSISRARDALTSRLNYPEIAIVEPIRIGRNSFIGFGSILMPGADIGVNCIVGAGSVVRGNVLDNSIMLGNPAICVGNSLEWASKKLQKNSIE
jgi:acetyltransferase-like isoleucine patch superfamily enzyme